MDATLAMCHVKNPFHMVNLFNHLINSLTI